MGLLQLWFWCTNFPPGHVAVSVLLHLILWKHSWNDNLLITKATLYGKMKGSRTRRNFLCPLTGKIWVNTFLLDTGHPLITHTLLFKLYWYFIFPLLILWQVMPSSGTCLPLSEGTHTAVEVTMLWNEHPEGQSLPRGPSGSIVAIRC